MTKVVFHRDEKTTSFDVKTGETLLQAADRDGVKLPNSCRQGLCHSCLMVAEPDIPIPIDAQKGLSEHQKSQQLFLACLCKPASDMTIMLPGNTGKTPAVLIAKRWLNDSVVELSFEVQMRWFPGQYITLWKNDDLARSYSIASNKKFDGLLKLHVKKHAQGEMSSWLADEVVEGAELMMSEAVGHCFYSEAAHDKPLLLVGTGTGLAPLYGIVRDALQQMHQAPIYLYSAANEPKDLYLVDELRTLASENENFHFHPVVRRLDSDVEDLDGDVEGIVEGDLLQIIPNAHRELRGWQVYLCGSPNMIEGLRKRCFLAGASGSDILVDAFVSNLKG